ncbi:hypothetical protein COLO4_26879 [Corchorus olitorius]|uniref:Uncharacterized protein n=1 Tax=Corchorus olitorius TaxID=93759 RepID=A0A1R3HU64_9ROSI|nr:hypothetical protein COLO4_26879 [Corchorus olitorius]
MKKSQNTGDSANSTNQPTQTSFIHFCCPTKRPKCFKFKQNLADNCYHPSLPPAAPLGAAYSHNHHRSLQFEEVLF